MGHFDETDLASHIDDYDRRRSALQPYGSQLFEGKYGRTPSYGWSEHTARQYSKPERNGFGAFIRSKGFDLR